MVGIGHGLDGKGGVGLQWCKQLCRSIAAEGTKELKILDVEPTAKLVSLQ